MPPAIVVGNANTVMETGRRGWCIDKFEFVVRMNSYQIGQWVPWTGERQTHWVANCDHARSRDTFRKFMLEKANRVCWVPPRSVEIAETWGGEHEGATVVGFDAPAIVDVLHAAGCADDVKHNPVKGTVQIGPEPKIFASIGLLALGQAVLEWGSGVAFYGFNSFSDFETTGIKYYFCHTHDEGKEAPPPKGIARKMFSAPQFFPHNYSAEKRIIERMAQAGQIIPLESIC